MSEKGISRIGMVAYIRYKGGIKGDDSLVDDRSTGEPLAVRLGAGRIPKGIEDAVMEMEVGEQRVVEVPSELGYGVYIEKDAQWYPRPMLDHGYDLHVGGALVRTNPESHAQRPAFVIEETKDEVKLDFNHPFAGKDLEYWVELVDLK